VRSRESDVNYSVGVVNPDNQPVFVSLNVEHNTTIPQNTRGANLLEAEG
jgi:hypothetical protein